MKGAGGEYMTGSYYYYYCSVACLLLSNKAGEFDDSTQEESGARNSFPERFFGDVELLTKIRNAGAGVKDVFYCSSLAAKCFGASTERTRTGRSSLEMTTNRRNETNTSGVDVDFVSTSEAS